MDNKQPNADLVSSFNFASSTVALPPPESADSNMLLKNVHLE